MKEFFVSDYVNDSEFISIINDVLLSKTEEEKLYSLNKLDSYISEKTGVSKMNIIFDDVKANGVYNFDDFIRINTKFIDLNNNFRLIEIYFHEKRHQIQHLCYLNKDELLGKEIIDEQRRFFDKRELTAITKKSPFSSTFGYFGMLVERDAYLYAYKQMFYLLELKNSWLDDKERLNLINYYKSKNAFFYDDEYWHWVEEHNKNFKIRKEAESSVLKRVKLMILKDMNFKELKSVIYSEILFDCLNDEEKNFVVDFFPKPTYKLIEKSERNLEKIIRKKMKEIKKRKKSSR